MQLAEHLGQDEKFTSIPNEMLERAYSLKMNGTQLSIVLTVWRFTFGFQRCQHEMSAKFIATATGIDKRNVRRELDNLSAMNVISILQQGERQTHIIQINKDITSWVGVNAPVGVKSPVGADTPPPVGVKSPVEVGAKSPPKKRNKRNINKESVWQVFSHWNNQKIIIHRELTPEIEKAICASLKQYEEEAIKTGITRYAIMYHDKKYFFGYKWGLIEFLKQANCLPDFLGEGVKWVNYIDQKARGEPKKAVGPPM